MDNRTTKNFSAGPGVLPLEVLQKIQQEMLNFADTGCSILELSTFLALHFKSKVIDRVSLKVSLEKLSAILDK